jgi:Na+-driven multidrug efflux pump
MTGLGVAIALCFLFLGAQIFGLIIPDPAAMEAGKQYLAVMACSTVFMMIELCTQGMFNGLGRTIEPAVINISLNLARIPLAILLASHWGIVGVWWAMAASTICKGIVLPVWFFILYGRIKKQKN